MKYIDTYWEKENLGINSAKLVIENDDSIEEIGQMLQNMNKEYIEADVAPKSFEIISYLESQGFHYMETLMELKGNAAEVAVPRAMKRFVGRTSYEPSTDQEMKVILQVIEEGEMFLTDKISLNPKFGVKKAGHRYKNWVETMLEGNAECFSIKYANKLIGFEVVKKDGDLVELCLGGGFPGSGMVNGTMTVTSSYNYWIAQGVKTIKTNVSSNNISVLKLHEAFGLKINNIRYVLVNDLRVKSI